MRVHFAVAFHFDRVEFWINFLLCKKEVANDGKIVPKFLGEFVLLGLKNSRPFSLYLYLNLTLVWR